MVMPAFDDHHSLGLSLVSALPDPPVEPDADLSSFDYMPLHGRMLKSRLWITAGSDAARMAILNLWLASWHSVPAGSLDDCDDMLRELSGRHADWDQVRPKVMLDWVRHSDGRLYSRELTPVVEKALGKRRAKSEDDEKRAERARARRAAERAAAEAGTYPEHARHVPGTHRARSASVPAEEKGREGKGIEGREGSEEESKQVSKQDARESVSDQTEPDAVQAQPGQKDEKGPLSPRLRRTTPWHLWAGIVGIDKTTGEPRYCLDEHGKSVPYVGDRNPGTILGGNAKLLPFIIDELARELPVGDPNWADDWKQVVLWFDSGAHWDNPQQKFSILGVIRRMLETRRKKEPLFFPRSLAYFTSTILNEHAVSKSGSG